MICPKCENEFININKIYYDNEKGFLLNYFCSNNKNKEILNETIPNYLYYLTQDNPYLNKFCYLNEHNTINAILFCCFCYKWYCKACSNRHLAENPYHYMFKKEFNLNQFCKKHLHNKVQFICIKCNQTLCELCKEEHIEHQLLNYKEYKNCSFTKPSFKSNQELSDTFTEITNKYKEQLSSANKWNNKHYYKDYVSYCNYINKRNYELYLFLSKIICIYNWLILSDNQTVNFIILQNMNNLKEVNFLEYLSFDEYLKLPFKNNYYSSIITIKYKNIYPQITTNKKPFIDKNGNQTQINYIKCLIDLYNEPYFLILSKLGTYLINKSSCLIERELNFNDKLFELYASNPIYLKRSKKIIFQAKDINNCWILDITSFILKPFIFNHLHNDSNPQNIRFTCVCVIENDFVFYRTSISVGIATPNEFQVLFNNNENKNPFFPGRLIKRTFPEQFKLTDKAIHLGNNYLILSQYPNKENNDLYYFDIKTFSIITEIKQKEEIINILPFKKDIFITISKTIKKWQIQNDIITCIQNLNIHLYLPSLYVHLINEKILLIINGSMLLILNSQTFKIIQSRIHNTQTSLFYLTETKDLISLTNDYLYLISINID